MTGRLAVAREAGFDEGMAAELAGPISHAFSDRHRAVLALADAIMTVPGSIAAELRERLQRNVSRSEVIAVLLNVLAFNKQKISVAAGHDVAARPGHEEFRFDETGRVERRP
jgi:hypothetical protein